MQDRALTVSVFNNYINNIIAAEEMLVNISIIGEVCDFGISKGIAYFSVKDEGALLSCVCFSEAVFSKLKNGTQTIITGSPQFWVKGGRFNFKVSSAREVGKGAFYEEFLRLKEKLEKQGYFAPEIKKPLPRFAMRIGVVTSRTGAVIRDICNVTSRRNPYCNIIMFDASVQGASAECEICDGISELDGRGLDVIIIARGGGSGEDLAVFNSEKIANAIFNAKTPIVSAVGHETDFTICDFVADLRAPTPSAAAELVVFDFIGAVHGFRNAFDGFWRSAVAATDAAIGKACGLFEGLSYAIGARFDEEQSKLKVQEALLAGKNPNEVLRQGYAILNKKYDDIKKGDKVEIILHKGRLIATINEKESTK